MPAHIKVIISILALAVTVAVFVFDTRVGGGLERWVALALGPLMVLGIWMFPEPKKATTIRQEAAERR